MKWLEMVTWDQENFNFMDDQIFPSNNGSSSCICSWTKGRISVMKYHQGGNLQPATYAVLAW